MSVYCSVVEKGFNCRCPEVDSRTKSTYGSIKIVLTYSIGRSAMSSAIGLDCVGQTVSGMHSFINPACAQSQNMLVRTGA